MSRDADDVEKVRLINEMTANGWWVRIACKVFVPKPREGIYDGFDEWTVELFHEVPGEFTYEGNDLLPALQAARAGKGGLDVRDPSDDD